MLNADSAAHDVAQIIFVFFTSSLNLGQMFSMVVQNSSKLNYKDLKSRSYKIQNFVTSHLHSNTRLI